MFGHLSDAGLELQADGSMTVNDTKLTSALGNVDELKKMFSNSERHRSDAGRVRYKRFASSMPTRCSASTAP